MPASGEDRLRELLAALAAQDAAELVAEARAAGRDEAREVLQRLWRDAYLEAAQPPRDVRREASPPTAHREASPPTAHSEPRDEASPRVAEPEASRGSAWWVYCVVSEVDAGRVPPHLRGVDPSGPVEIVARGELAAVVSRVPLPEFGDERLREHLEDLTWVEQVARAHEHVLEATMTVTTIVPLRLCTIYLSRERVETFLDEQAHELAGALAGLRGRTEWGVKVFAPPLERPAVPGEAAGGSEYLQRKRGERAAREEAHRRAAQCAQDVHERLEREAVRACVNRPQHPEAHGRATEMLLNGAYLIDDERRSAVREVIDELVDEYGPLGFSIELTGPWPPYNFVAPSASAIR
jgi:Gas vesicle synthesis protein GvpL/GvpF